MGIEVFYDGACPVCVRQKRALLRRDKKGTIHFTDIVDPGFDPGLVGLDRGTLMERIHARLDSGEVVSGVEVFRRLYDALGFGTLVRVSRARGVSKMLDVGYDWFASHRLRRGKRC